MWVDTCAHANPSWFKQVLQVTLHRGKGACAPAAALFVSLTRYNFKSATTPFTHARVHTQTLHTPLIARQRAPGCPLAHKKLQRRHRCAVVDAGGVGGGQVVARCRGVATHLHAALGGAQWSPGTQWWSCDRHTALHVVRGDARPVWPRGLPAASRAALGMACWAALLCNVAHSLINTTSECMSALAPPLGCT